MASDRLSNAELESFMEVMIEKSRFRRGLTQDPDEFLEDVVRNVVVDTELLVSGAIPLERWLEEPPWQLD